MPDSTARLAFGFEERPLKILASHGPGSVAVGGSKADELCVMMFPKWGQA